MKKMKMATTYVHMMNGSLLNNLQSFCKLPLKIAERQQWGETSTLELSVKMENDDDLNEVVRELDGIKAYNDVNSVSEQIFQM